MSEVTRELTNAHYLHTRAGLEPLLRPPVEEPTCLAWLPGAETLLVGNRRGQLFSVDPIMGTAPIASDLGWTDTIAVHPKDDRYAVLNGAGQWTVGRVGGEVIASGQHAFNRRMSAFFHQDYLVLAGDAIDGRYVLVIADGKVAARIRVPHRSIPALDGHGKLVLVRSTTAGVQVCPLSRNPRVTDEESTAHHLVAYDATILGHTVIGMVVWSRADLHNAVSLRMTDLSVACLSPDGTRAAMGTRSGSVAMARLSAPEDRAHPELYRAFEGSVKAIEFASKGRWLATAGDHLIVWTWED